METYRPAAQALHADEEDAPVTELYLPASQAVHADDTFDPVATLYRPATHVGQELWAVEL